MPDFNLQFFCSATAFAPPPAPTGDEYSQLVRCPPPPAPAPPGGNCSSVTECDWTWLYPGGCQQTPIGTSQRISCSSSTFTISSWGSSDCTGPESNFTTPANTCTADEMGGFMDYQCSPQPIPPPGWPPSASAAVTASAAAVEEIPSSAV